MGPLACAVTFEHKEVVRLLLKWGAKHTALAARTKVSSDGRDEKRAFDQKTPFQIAEWTGDGDMGVLIRQLNRGLLQKTQNRKLPNLTTCARTPFWSFCAGQRRIGPGQITDEA